MAKPPYKGRDANGHAVYDLSGDEAAAKAGDEDARLRLITQRRLSARRPKARRVAAR